MIATIISILLLGALLGLVFSKRGKEGDGAIQGAKTAGGCLVTIVIIGIIAVIAIVAILL